MSLLKNEKTEAGRVELQFTLGAEEFSAAVNSTYKKEAKNFNVPGFRKGKAPRHLIEKMYGEEIFYTDAVNELFPKAYEEAVKEAGIEPVDRPDAEIVSADLTDGVVLKALVYVKPEVKIGE
ncbi:MAG: trigger factor family protein, partial [Oscillospiraceae bacterium]|nr:trigger factor family protein [Oscillospiraceae bacterium]